MLTSVAFQNFKSLRAVEIPLAPLTLLVGGNGAGKTSVLGGIRAISHLRSRDWNIYASPLNGDWAGVSSWEALKSAGTSGSDALVMQLQLEHHGLLRLRLSDAEHRLSFKSPGDAVASEVEFQSGHWDPWDRVRQDPVLRDLDTTLSLRLDAARSSSAHVKRDGDGKIDMDGTGLAAVLGESLGRREGHVEHIEELVRSVVPSFRRLRVVSTETTVVRKVAVEIGSKRQFIDENVQVPASVIELQRPNGSWIPAELASEGTLLVLALATALVCSPPRLLLVDDIDKGLHPTAQRVLIEAIQQIQHQRPDLQIIATTHSPYLVDCVPAESVRLLALDSEGWTHAAKLTDHPKWQQSKEVFETGEFWSAVGEDWLVEQASPRATS